MGKIRVLAVLGGEGRKYELKQRLTCDEIAFLGFADFGDETLRKAQSYIPNAVVIVDDDKDEKKALTAAESIYVTFPGCAILLLKKNVDLAFVEKAMQVGVRKVLSIACSRKELVEAIEQGYRVERTRSVNSDLALSDSVAKIITVFGAKGGIGKSTIATNLAVSLARKDKRVAVVDLDLQFGDINLFLDLSPKDSIAELVQDKQALDIETIRSYMLMHSSRVNVLCAPKSPEMAEIVQGERVEKIIDVMRPYFDYIVIDAPPYFNEVSMVAIESADIILTVIALDIATLRNTKISLDLLESLQQKDKVCLLANRDAPGIISVKDAQNILDHPVKFRVTSDWKTATSALNRGVPIVMDAPRSAIGKDLLALANRILEDKDLKTKQSRGDKA